MCIRDRSTGARSGRIGRKRSKTGTGSYRVPTAARGSHELGPGLPEGVPVVDVDSLVGDVAGVFQVNQVRVGLADREPALDAKHLAPGTAPVQHLRHLNRGHAWRGAQPGHDLAEARLMVQAQALNALGEPDEPAVSYTHLRAHETRH